MKRVTARALNLIQIFQQLCRRVQRLRERPLKRIIPEIRCQPTEALLNRRGAAQNLFSTGIDRTLGLGVEQFAGKTRNQFMRSRVKIRELRIELVD